MHERYHKTETNPLFEESAKTTETQSDEAKGEAASENEEVKKAVRFAEGTKLINFVGILKNNKNILKKINKKGRGCYLGRMSAMLPRAVLAVLTMHSRRSSTTSR